MNHDWLNEYDDLIEELENVRAGITDALSERRSRLMKVIGSPDADPSSFAEMIRALRDFFIAEMGTQEVEALRREAEISLQAAGFFERMLESDQSDWLEYARRRINARFAPNSQSMQLAAMLYRESESEDSVSSPLLDDVEHALDSALDDLWGRLGSEAPQS